MICSEHTDNTARCPECLALYWQAVAGRLRAENERLRGIIENLEMQSVDGIAAGWVCVPAVEWQSNIDTALRGEGEV